MGQSDEDLRDRYLFVLDYDDLDEDLQSIKIDEYIRKDYANAIKRWEQGDEMQTLNEALADDYNRNDAEEKIRAHFPLYF